MSSASARIGPAPTERLSAALGAARGPLMAGLFVVGLASATTDRIYSSIVSRGWGESIANTFDISAIVWGAVWASVSLCLRDRSQPVSRLDWAAAALASLLFLMPFTVLSWVGVTGLALYTTWTAGGRLGERRGAWIAFAVTVTLFWSPKIFEAFSPTVLAADAELVSWITGTERVGNTVRIAGTDSFIWVAPGCSSLANMSLAFLCWMTFGQMSKRPVRLVDWSWCIAAAAAVVALNVSRIAIIALRPDLYETVHGTGGTMVAGYLTLAVIVGTCVVWKRHEIFRTV